MTFWSRITFLLSFVFLGACSQGGGISSIGEEPLDDYTPPIWSQPGTRYLLGYINQASGSASIFSTNTSKGFLSPHANSPLSLQTGLPDQKPSVSPNSKCWFFHTTSQGFHGYNYNPTTNSFMALAQNPFQNTGNRVLTAIDSSNRYLFSIENDTLQSYALDSSCNPTAIPGGSHSLAGAHRIVVDSHGSFVFVLTTNRDVHRYTIQSNGTLTAGPSVHLNLAMSSTFDMIEYGGKFLFITSSDGNEIEVVQFDSSGNFSSTGKQSTGMSPKSPVISNDGNYLFLVNSGSTTMSVFGINSTSGSLQETSGSPFAIGSGSAPISIAQLPGSDLVFIAFQGALDNLMVYQINPLTGGPNQTALISHRMADSCGGIVAHKITYSP